MSEPGPSSIASPAASPVVWTETGLPRSALYDDVYFSSADGLAETRAVFLQGCGLPEAWAGRSRFVVAELGFGTGLNILALADLWRRHRPPGGRLHVFSVEAHPLARDDAARALATWPELADLAELLLSRWPSRAPGFHRVELPEIGLVLDLAVMEVAAALTAWSGQADAWFLDGFAPAANPAMWRQEVLDLVAGRSAPGARAATFTVAGVVRRGLAQAGFAVDKRPGFGRKRERLEARLPGSPPVETPPPRIAVVGAGVAGCAAVRALRILGCDVVHLDAVGRGAGGSGNPAALVTPRLDAGHGPPSRLFAQAIEHAARLYDAQPGAVVAEGVVQLAGAERDPARFAKVVEGGLFAEDALRPLEPAAAAERIGEAAAPAGLMMACARVIVPEVALAAWASSVTVARVARLDHGPAGWRLWDTADNLLAEADAVILAAALDTQRLSGGPTMRPVRGQVSVAVGVSPAAPTAWGGYAAPTRDGVVFGATHDRDDESDELRPADHARNLATLAAALPGLAARIGASPLSGRASVRATTPDHLPLAGPPPDHPPGLFLLAGFGGRGFAVAPLLADHVAALATGAPSPLPADLAEAVDPGRFARRLRSRKRGAG